MSVPRVRSISEFTVSTETSAKTESSTESKGHSRSVSTSSADRDAMDVRHHDTRTAVVPPHSRMSLAALLSNSGPGPLLFASPYPSTEHHLLPAGSGPPLVVYQNEPSSIIAYALASVDYENQLAELQADLVDQAAAAPVPPPSAKAQCQSDRPDRWFDNIEREEPNRQVLVHTQRCALDLF